MTLNTGDLLRGVPRLPAILADAGGATFWLPQDASSSASSIDQLFYFIYYISAFFFILIVTLMIVFAVRYRRRRPDQMPERTTTHNTPLEITWSVIPIILVCVMFWWGFKIYLDVRTPPDNAYDIQVSAQRWSWLFTYPAANVTSSELHVPVDQPIRLRMESADVIHSFFVPAFRVKMDVVPGRYTYAWFRASQPGEYNLFCAEYCGTGHSDMHSVVVVHAPGEFEKWLENADPLKKLTDEQYAAYLKDPEAFIQAHPEIENLETPAVIGRKMYLRQGCASCHSVDGTAGTGPTFKGIYGHQQPLRDGSTITIDDNYIRESILEPNAKVVQGYEPIMPTFKGRIKDREIGALIEYLKSLK